jgi:capsular polysaccharide biosynthesis protein
LRDKFKRLRAASDGQRKLFISRGESLNTHARRLLNEDEIASLASKQGFEIVCCEKLSFEAQVTLFSEARIIVGAHGAGLANLVFAPRTAKVVELMGPRLNDPPQGRAAFVSPMFMKLASIVGQTYVRVVGKSDSGEVHMDFLPFETYSIEPAEFLAAVHG